MNDCLIASIRAAALAVFLAGSLAVRGQWMVSGNENKVDLITGAPRVLPKTSTPDSISILDFSKFPPTVRHVEGIANTVIGPPSNIAILPGDLAFIADSIKLDPNNATNWLPNSSIHVVDLKTGRRVDTLQAELQPSGMSISKDGRLALVANRASGSISVFGIQQRSFKNLGSVKICAPLDNISDVAISPDGRMALASVQKAGYLALLEIAGDRVTFTGRKISAYGQPYRCVITPDGELGLTAGLGYGNAVDKDALTIIDLKSTPPRTIGYVPLGAVPESIEISPNGRILAAVAMDGSNLPPGDPNHTEMGTLLILERRGRTFVETQRLDAGRIPEGVAFTPDGKYLVVQAHPDRELRVFKVQGTKVRDTGHRIAVPGMPSSLRASAR